jgi:RNA polymerase sigma-70 factor (ECF subfamily)
MSPPPNIPDDELAATVKRSWQRFLDVYEPVRPELYRYCRYLTRSPWDAEDLCQDTLARAFVTLGALWQPPPSPRAWLFRVASNLWIDRARHAASAPAPEGRTAHAAPDPRASREAGGTLLVRLSPQERTALVLKEVFDLTLEEIAETLETTVGATKAALHRGRGKLLEEVDADEEASRVPAAGVLDAFCEAFNARDLERLTALLLDHASVEVVGASRFYGARAAKDTALHGMLFGSKRMAAARELGGIDPAFIQGVLPLPARMELLAHRGEILLLSYYQHEDGVEAVRAVTRAQVEGDKIVALQNYFFTPDLIADVCRELGLPFRVNGYRYWITGCV